MFIVEFPYDIGTFVRLKSTDIIGTISCYNCVDNQSEPEDAYVVVVSGYKDAWCGEFLMTDIEILTNEEIKEIMNKYR